MRREDSCGTPHPCTMSLTTTTSNKSNSCHSRNGNTTTTTESPSLISSPPDDERQKASHTLTAHLDADLKEVSSEQERPLASSDDQLTQISTQVNELALGSRAALQRLGNDVERIRGDAALTRGELHDMNKHVKETFLLGVLLLACIQS